ncbi:MAG: sensor histidine kinase [Acidimicrobiales bacterium]
MVVWTALVAAAVAGAVGYWLGRRRFSTGVDTTTEASAVHAAQSADIASQPASKLDIERALADLRLGVVLVGHDGVQLYRNNRALHYATGRHGDALVEAALQRVIDGALVGLSLEEHIEVYGPPARSLLVQASPTYENGEVRGAVGVIDDVTEARHTDRVRSDFVANVSHELRTPVGAMSVLAETIADADDPEVIDRLTGRMQREAYRLASTIDDLLALSKLESGAVSDPETIDLVSVATMAIERTGESAEQRGVLVGLSGDSNATESSGSEPPGPVLIDGDQGQLVSAVANLIDNAIKYSDTGATVSIVVRVATPNPDADQDSTDRGAELSVIDSGIGIPDRDLDRIFERFYRVDTARRRETGGTGLGLSIVRHALLNHGGTVDVESVEGQGSTFTIRLPLSPAQAQIVPQP